MSTALALNISSTGTTSTHPVSAASPVAGIAPAPAVAAQDDDHRRGLKRWFIGPMPEKVAVNRVQIRKRSFIARHGSLPFRPRGHRTSADGDDGDATDDSASVISDDPEEAYGHVRGEQLYRYFKKRGGEDQDWNDETRRGLRMEIKRKWQESPWHHVWKPEKNKKNVGSRKWVGESFIVGSVLGVASGSSGSTIANGSLSSLGQHGPHAPRRDTDTSVPQIHIDAGPNDSGSGTDNPSPSRVNASREALIPPLPFRSGSSSDSHTRDPSQVPLPPAGSDELEARPPAALRPALKPDGGQSTQRRKSVNFKPTRSMPSETAPPETVLARTEDAIEGTSAGGVGAHNRETNEVIMQDRMLVNISYFETDGLPQPYDQDEARRHPTSEKEAWAEYLVCWKRRHLELYEEWSVPGMKWLTHSKHLAFLVPLKKLGTHLSVYSMVDLSFCITCPPVPLNLNATSAADKASKRSVIRSTPRGGTFAFVFKCKSRSRSADWMWHLWREIGGTLPEVIEVNVPQLGSRIRFDVPSSEFLEVTQGYKTINRSYILDTCRQEIGTEDWRRICDDAGSVELCWRRNGNLEWIWLDRDVDGNPRDWSVIYPVGFRRLKAPIQLEIRPARHAGTKVVLSDGTRLSEPPAVEGYLYRIKANTQARTQMYLSSHDGNLFTLSTANAHAPEPPAPPITLIDHDAKTKEQKRAAELQRGAQQIFRSDGYIDFRSIIAIRRATQTTVPRFAAPNNGNTQDINQSLAEDDLSLLQSENGSASDIEDAGGDEVLNSRADKQRLKLKRSFDVTLRTGHVIRFETHSATIALQWISRLRALTSYWTRRHRVDARQEMDLTHAMRGLPKWGSSEIVPDAAVDHPYLEREVLIRKKGVHDRQVSLAEPVPSTEFWSWCVLEGCRPIIKAGRLYEKRGPHKQFKHMFHVLTHGHIVQYYLTATKSARFTRSTTINLLDAYIYSGQLAVATLPQGSAGTSQATPKRYQDGLEADDDDEDVTFIIWYRSHSTGASPHDITTPDQRTHIPPLDGKHHMLICKARSILERDSWCFALNCEIERLARRTASREKDLKEMRGMPY
ncbi:hypothetical protein FRB97_000071 [Tulasnella sp. 331]|nr:hypothetical protein FRB97_000071 [Tulasnella sp. 331]